MAPFLGTSLRTATRTHAQLTAYRAIGQRGRPAPSLVVLVHSLAVAPSYVTLHMGEKHVLCWTRRAAATNTRALLTVMWQIGVHGTHAMLTATQVNNDELVRTSSQSTAERHAPPSATCANATGSAAQDGFTCPTLRVSSAQRASIWRVKLPRHVRRALEVMCSPP